MKKVLGIHGNGQTKNIFKNFDIDNFTALDLPGHGASKPIDNYSLKNYASILNQEIKAETIIIGHSLGGHIALEMAQSNQLIKGLILIGAPPINNNNLSKVFLPNPTIPVIYEENPCEDKLLAFIKEGSETRECDQELLEMFKQQDPKARSGFAASLANGVEDEMEKLEKLNIPYHYFFGSKEKLININFLQDILGESMSTVHAGHNIMLDNIQDLTDRIKSLINKWSKN